MSDYTNDHDETPKAGKKKAGRHGNGRWKKGHCPNPLGRRKAKINRELEMVKSLQQHSPDIFDFGRATVEMRIGGETVYMSREAAVLHKRYECAMKGSVIAQRDLMKDFQKNAEMRAQVRKLYDDLQMYWYIDHPQANDPSFEIPANIKLELTQLQSLLSDMYPYNYKKP